MKTTLSCILDIIGIWLAVVFIFTTPIAIFEYAHPLPEATFALVYAGSFFILAFMLSVVWFGLSRMAVEISGFCLFLSIVYLAMSRVVNAITLANVWSIMTIVLVGLVCLAFMAREIKYSREQRKQGGALWN